ncbi:2-oxoacid:acceptor oxidoreductase family protein [Brachyspira pilosicoli]|uniref:2-oxoacid:acceptor oxidoreductase family protein n=1 Tax=Brachyspira pilosicoli TaxID=52584 RepID=UPI001C6762C7|nr:2-oxoacid:acceptor oxidoreductase family protein [Brachyspira pilosicoli]MBW5396762.1 2-oxoacid:ferredoxin oxidoreductase subunit gamma [Brachyspira pilosicoli]
MSTERLIFAGFGGQGVMSMGQMIAYAGMIENKHVTWCPSYGPEMRGGTANCSVVVSDELVGSPIVSHDATAAVIMNLPSLTKFEKDVLPNGVLLINSSLIEKKASRNDVRVAYVEANKIAGDIGNPKAANMVMLGALLTLQNIVSFDSIQQAFLKVFGERKKEFLPGNEKALNAGRDAVKNLVS